MLIKHAYKFVRATTCLDILNNESESETQIEHKIVSLLQVDEEGAEAAAVTLVMMSIFCSAKAKPQVPPPIPFLVDHPFLFAILTPPNPSTYDPLLPVFLGHCVHPGRQ